MQTRPNPIPDHSSSAIAEGYDAALIRAGFHALEARELRQFRQEERGEPSSASDRARFIRDLRRRVRARRTRTFLTQHLPRAAQLATCLIGIIAIGMGVAIAASPSAREWTAGVLVGSAQNLPGLEGWYDPSPMGFRGGARLDGSVYLLDTFSDTIRRIDGTNSDEVTFTRADAGDGAPTMLSLAASQGELYAVCGKDYRSPEGAFIPCPGACLICKVAFDGDSFSLATLWESDINALYGLPEDADTLVDIQSCAELNGAIYVVVYYRDRDQRNQHKLIAYEIATGAVHQWPAPGGGASYWDCVYLFSGPEGRIYLTRESQSDSFDGTRVYRLEDDGSFSPAGEIAAPGTEYPFGFAYCFESDSVYYVRDHLIYRAPGGDFTRAERAGVSMEEEGEGIMLDANSYMLVNGDHAQVYDLRADAGESVILTIGGNGGPDPGDAQALNQRYPNVVVQDAVQSAGPEELVQLPAGAADVWSLSDEAFAAFREAGRYLPFESEALSKIAAELYPHMRERITSGGQLIAIPSCGFIGVYFDYDAELLAQLGCDPERIKTWSGILGLLAGLARDPRAQDFCVGASGGSDFAQSLFDLMSDCFARTCVYQGRTVDFTDPRYRNLMEQLRAIDFSAFRYAPDGGNDPYLFGFGRHVFEIDARFPSFTPSISADDPAVTRCYGEYLVVDPDTRHPEEAVAYLECVAENYHEEDMMLLGRAIREADNTPENIAAIREGVGDVDSFTLFKDLSGGATLIDACRDAIKPYLRGEASFEACAERMNEIVNG